MFPIYIKKNDDNGIIQRGVQCVIVKIHLPPTPNEGRRDMLR
jgi:hypothetical protein